MNESISETRTEHPATASINGGPRVPALLFIYTRTTWLPDTRPSTDPTWSFTDAAGHWHGFTEDSGLLPTLDSPGGVLWCQRTHRAGDPCPGYHLPTYTCKICAEVVVPRFGPPVAEATAIPTIGRWSAAVDHGIKPDPVRVQARFYLPDGSTLVGTGDTTGDKPNHLAGVGSLATIGAAGVRPLPFHQIAYK